MKFNKSISNLLISLSVGFTFVAFLYPEMYNLLGINRYNMDSEYFYLVFIQFFTWTFLHWSISHILLNSIFVYYFWNILELLIWKKRFLMFFIFSTIFIGTWIILTTDANTIWISWFAMALLTYYTLELRSRNNPEYKWWITAIIINVWIWILPQISMHWHLYWVIAWVVFYILNKHFFTPKLVWMINFSWKDVELKNI